MLMQFIGNAYGEEGWTCQIRYRREGPCMGFYDEIGVRPFINAGGWTYTRYGGSIMTREVLAAMADASRHFVNLVELQSRLGDAIAQLTHNEAAFVSCGAASGILLAVAGCMAGTDATRADRLPDSSDMRNEVVMHRCDRGTEADPAIRAAGGRIVDAGDSEGTTEAQFVDALNERTAAIVLLAGERDGKLDVTRVVALAHARDIPVLVDGAYGVPPKDNLWRYTQEFGCDAFITSGGKAIRGPQSTGLVLGTRRIIEGCRFHASPNLRVGRGMKVGKEEFAGIYTALKLFLVADHEAQQAARIQRIKYIVDRLQDLAGVTPVITRDGTAVEIEFDPSRISTTGEAIEKELLAGDPSILLWARGTRIWVRSNLLQPGEEEVVGDRLRSILGGDAAGHG